MTGQDPVKRPTWELLRATRSHLGLSQIQVSQQLGITQSGLSRWERSGRGLPAAAVAKIETFIAERIGGASEASTLTLQAADSDTAQNGRASARIRKALGLKQQQVAELAGINRTSLSMFENGYASLSSDEFTKLCSVLEREVQALGGEIKAPVRNTLARERSGSSANLPALEYLFGAAKHQALRKIEAQLDTYADPAFRLKLAEEQIDKIKQDFRDLNDSYIAAKQKIEKIEAENVDHKKHKELLGNFAAAQESLILCQTEKILTLEHNPNRDFGKGIRTVADIDGDMMEARRKVGECHRAIITELERKTPASSN